LKTNSLIRLFSPSKILSYDAEYDIAQLVFCSARYELRALTSSASPSFPDDQLVLNAGNNGVLNFKKPLSILPGIDSTNWTRHRQLQWQRRLLRHAQIHRLQ